MATLKKKILIAEDDQMTLNLYKIKFGKMKNWELTLVQDGKKALDYLENQTPDLIILDIRLPIIDGIEIYKKIKDDKRMVNSEIIFVTNIDSVEEISSQDIEINNIDFIVKSETPLKEIFNRVKELLA